MEAGLHAGSEVDSSTARPESARLEQIEQALSTLASVVTRLAKEVQQSRLALRVGEADANGREMLQSLQARVAAIEERVGGQESLMVGGTAGENAALESIRESLAALAGRRQG